MKTYELMCVFNTKENHYPEGVQAVKDKLQTAGAVIEKEDDMGDRNLAYMLGKEIRGHYHLFTFQSAADIFTKLDEQLKLQSQLMRHLIVCKKSRPVKPPRSARHHRPAAHKATAEEA